MLFYGNFDHFCCNILKSRYTTSHFLVLRVNCSSWCLLKHIHNQVDDQVFIMTSRFQSYISGVNHFLQWEFWHRCSKSIVNTTCNKNLLPQVVSKSMNIYICNLWNMCQKLVINLSMTSFLWGKGQNNIVCLMNVCHVCEEKYQVHFELFQVCLLSLYLSRKVYPKLWATQRIERWIYVCIVIEQVTQRQTLENIIEVNIWLACIHNMRTS